MRRLSKPKTNQEFVWNSWCLQYILVQQKTYFLCPLTEQDILDLVTRRLWDHDLIYVCGGQCVRRGIHRGALNSRQQ